MNLPDLAELTVDGFQNPEGTRIIAFVMEGSSDGRLLCNRNNIPP